MKSYKLGPFRLNLQGDTSEFDAMIARWHEVKYFLGFCVCSLLALWASL